jgi:peptide/nickel transport system substrate-binding protein
MGRFCDPKVDELLTKARTTVNLAERKAAYEAAAPTILSQGEVLYLYHRTLLFAHTPRLEGFRVMPDGLIRVTGLRLK